MTTVEIQETVPVKFSKMMCEQIKLLLQTGQDLA